jgi:hypothetical protein
MPKPGTFNTKEDSVEILSTNPPPEQPLAIKSRNCQVVVRQLGQQFGTLLFQACPELLAYMRLEGINLSSNEGLEVS